MKEGRDCLVLTSAGAQDQAANAQQMAEVGEPGPLADLGRVEPHREVHRFEKARAQLGIRSSVTAHGSSLQVPRLEPLPPDSPGGLCWPARARDRRGATGSTPRLTVYKSDLRGLVSQGVLAEIYPQDYSFGT